MDSHADICVPACVRARACARLSGHDTWWMSFSQDNRGLTWPWTTGPALTSTLTAHLPSPLELPASCSPSPALSLLQPGQVSLHLP